MGQRIAREGSNGSADRGNDQQIRVRLRREVCWGRGAGFVDHSAGEDPQTCRQGHRGTELAQDAQNVATDVVDSIRGESLVDELSDIEVVPETAGSQEGRI